MRPLRLRMKGLRSYRGEREIDFSNVDLVAIVGDTSAGKSSILEAITYALYNGTTWGPNVKELISTGEQTVTVELEFQADGDRYRVRRSTSVGVHPLPVHGLECLSDPSQPAIDREAPVNARIVELLGGMSREQFLSAVILPQGKFQNLLQARQGDRTEILKGIFRLEHLDRVHDLAEDRHREYRPHLERLRERRAALPREPRLEAERARRDQDAAGKERERLRGLRDTVRAADRAAAAASQLAGGLARLRGSLVGADLRSAAGLQRLLAALREIEGRRAATGEALEAAHRRLAEIERELAPAVARGEDLAGLLSARQALSRLAGELPAIARERARLDREERGLGQRRAALERERPRVEELKRLAAGTAARRDQGRRRLLEAQRALARSSQAVAAWRAQLEIVRQARAQARALVATVASLERKAAAAGAAAERARGELEGAAAELEQVQRQNAAAHAARDHRPGEPCPVCARPLPAGFTPPLAPEEAPRRRALARAQARAAGRAEAAAGATARLDQARSALLAAESGLAARQARQGELERQLRDLLPGGGRASGLEARFRRQARSAEALEAGLGRISTEAEGQRLAADTAAARVEGELRRLADALRALGRGKRRVEERARDCERERARIPASLRPPAPLARQGLAAASARADRLLEGLRKLDRERERELESSAELRSALTRLEEEERERVSAPRREVSLDLNTLYQRALDAAGELNRQPPSARPEAGGLEEELAWALELEDAASSLAADLERRHAQAVARAGELQEAAARLQREAGIASAQALEESFLEASTNARLAAVRHRESLEQIPLADDLDGRIAQGGALVQSLADLAQLLTPARFTAFVVRRRQRALIGIASDLLGSMTGQGFGFAEDFQVVDRHSGQVRGTRTLSGGETFLASLALALGLVELAGRSGGRLEALFLDEGFGSLDANALDEALSELERRAAGGRLVAIVSHLKTVAERIESVLSVTRTAAGSQARWLRGAERDAMVEEEIERGLLV